MSNIKQAKEIVSKELSLPASKLVGGTVANNSGTLEGTDLQLIYSEGYVNGTAKNTSEVLAGTTTIAPTWKDGTNYVKKVKDGSWVAVENAPMFGTLPDVYTGKEVYSNGKWYQDIGLSTVDNYDPFDDGSGVALYKLDGDATDESDNYDGDATAITYEAGRFGQCAISPVNSRIETTYSATLSAITMSLWIKQSTTNRRMYIFDGGCSLSFAGSSSVALNFIHNSSALFNDAALGTEISNNQWHHVLVTWGKSVNSGFPRLYIDGVERTPAGLVAKTTDWVMTNIRPILHLQDGSTAYVDQMRLLNRPLTPSEVTTLYNEELPLFTELPPQTYLPYTVEATGGSVTAVNEWKYPDLVTETSYSNELRTDKLMMNGMEAFACRAWVNFNGTGTVAIRASGNVSSITDNGTGNYTVNFTTAMPDADYAAIGNTSTGAPVNYPITVLPYVFGISSVRIQTTYSTPNTNGATDYPNVVLAIFR